MRKQAVAVPGGDRWREGLLTGPTDKDTAFEAAPGPGRQGSCRVIVHRNVALDGIRAQGVGVGAEELEGTLTHGEWAQK